MKGTIMDVGEIPDLEGFLGAHASDLIGPALSFRVCYWGVQPHHLDNAPHAHAFFEVCYVRGGSGAYLEAGRVYPLRAGILFCSRPGIVHQIKSSTGLDLAYVAFEVNQERSDRVSVAAYHRLYDAARVALDGTKLIHSPSLMLWQSLLTSAESPSWTSTVVLPPLALALLTSFAATFGTDPGPSGSGRDPAYTVRQVEDICGFIQDHLASEVSLNDLAQQFHVSSRHLSRIFHRVMGQSVTAYLRYQRLSQAKRLLRETGLSVDEIAERVGYHSIYYFSQAFSASFGMPPGRYRRRWQEPPRSQP